MERVIAKAECIITEIVIINRSLKGLYVRVIHIVKADRLLDELHNDQNLDWDRNESPEEWWMHIVTFVVDIDWMTHFVIPEKKFHDSHSFTNKIFSKINYSSNI